MKKVTAYLALPLLLLALVFLYGFSSDRNSRKKISRIEVEFEAGNNHFLTHELVNKLLIQNESNVKNQPKSSINLHHLETTVSSNPYVERATVFLTLEGILKTHIKQREPLARITSGKENYYVDKYGVKMPLSENFSARVPLVSGVKSSVEIKEITQLVTRISKNSFLKKEIIGIQKTNNGEYIFNVRTGDYEIDFGEFVDVEEKFKKLIAFYNKSLFDGTIKKYKKIIVKYRNQVVCTKQHQDGKQ